MEALDRYKQAWKDIAEYFSYNGASEDIDDGRDYNWYISGETELRFQEEPIELLEDSYWDEPETTYAEEISYHHQWKKGFVCRSSEFTLVLLQICTGDGKLMILDNSKEYKVP